MRPLPRIRPLTEYVVHAQVDVFWAKHATAWLASFNQDV